MRRTGAGWRAVLLTASGIALTAAGCANFVDEVSRRDFRIKHLFVDPDPMTVLRESKDGDARARALRNLEYKPTAGSSITIIGVPHTEEWQFLTEAATSDPRPLCRLAAIERLGRWDDSRASAVLLEAYQKAADFPTDAANPIRCEAMTALGKKNTTDGLALLAQVAATPRGPAPKSDVRLAGFNADEDLNVALGQYDPDKQAARDARLAAVRALGATKNPQAAGVLIPLLDEKDVALRDRAHEALQNITGRKDVPPDADAWRKAIGAAGK